MPKPADVATRSTVDVVIPGINTEVADIATDLLRAGLIAVRRGATQCGDGVTARSGKFAGSATSEVG